MSLTKPITIYYVHSRNYQQAFNYVAHQLTGFKYDTITYKNDHWYGINNVDPSCIAWFDQPELTDIFYTRLLYLIDDKYHVLKTAYGNTLNYYTTVYITSSLDLEELFCSEPSELINSVKTKINMIHIFNNTRVPPLPVLEHKYKDHKKNIVVKD